MQCTLPSCGLTYNVLSRNQRCGNGHLLDVVYNGVQFDPGYLKRRFARRVNHDGNIFDESGVWRFRELINFPGIDTENREQQSRILVSHDGREGSSHPYRMSVVAEFCGIDAERLWLQPEGYNPSGSFKDNGMATGFTHAKMLGIKEIGCASTGNTSASAAMYGANEGVKVIVYVPKGKIAAGKLAQAYQFRSEVVEVDGKFDDAMRRVEESGIYLMNSINPFRLEGQKTIIYRALEHIGWIAPDWIVVPGGNLGNSASFGKALKELYDWRMIDRLPRLAVVNASGANTLYRLFNGRFEGQSLKWNDGNVDLGLIGAYYKMLDDIDDSIIKTEATAIQIGRPVNLIKALRALEQTNGVVIQVSDDEMIEGMVAVGRNGFDCEIASAAVPAGIRQMVRDGVIERDETVVGVLTGRLKDPEHAVRYFRGH